MNTILAVYYERADRTHEYPRLTQNLSTRPTKTTIADGEKYISLFADASFCQETKAYGWCYWIKYGAPSKIITRHGGGLRIKSSQEAEIEALRQGLREIYALAFNGKRIVVQSDCLGALYKIGKELNAIKEAGAQSAYTKHVKGHQGRRNAPASINTQCDRIAGQQMRQFREEKRRLDAQNTPT